MKIWLLVGMLAGATLATEAAQAGSCGGGHHTHSSESSDKKKTRSGI